MPHRPEIITSPQNPRIKSLVALRERKERDAAGLCLVEGAREIQMAIRNGFTIETIYVCRELTNSSGSHEMDQNTQTISDAATIDTIELGRAAFEKVAMRDSRDGLIATIKTKNVSWKDFWLTRAQSSNSDKNILILAAQNIEKPGNLGALLRTADAAGVDALVALDQTIDVWNPNAIRASLGCVFHVPVVQMKSEEFIQECRQNHITTVAAALSERSKTHHEVAMNGAVAIVMGSEAHGLSQLWMEQADTLAIIPMRGQVDSMNVSVAAGIMVFEALRQRNITASVKLPAT